MLAAHLGRPIRFEAITQGEWTERMRAMSNDSGDGVINPDMARHISAVGSALAAASAPVRAPDADELRQLTGIEVHTLTDFLKEHRALFSPS